MRPAPTWRAAPEACPPSGPLWSHHQISPRPGQAGQLAPSSLCAPPQASCLLSGAGSFTRFSLPPPPLPRAHTSQTPAGFSNQRGGSLLVQGTGREGLRRRPQAGRGSWLGEAHREGRRGGAGRGGVGGAAHGAGPQGRRRYLAPSSALPSPSVLPSSSSLPGHPCSVSALFPSSRTSPPSAPR